MAQKLKPTTKIPTIPKLTLIKSATSTLNLNLFENTAQKSTKLPPITRAPRLRRSKSVTDFRSISTTTKKRPGLAEWNPIPNKVVKVSKPEPKPIQPKIAPYDFKGRYNYLKEKQELTVGQNTHLLNRAPRLRRSKSVTDFSSVSTTTKKRPGLAALNPIPNKVVKVSKPIQPKIAPYDFKGRYNHLKEIHDKLKVSHQELKVEYDLTVAQNTDLLTRSTRLQSDFDSIQELLESTTKELNKIKGNHDTMQSKLSSTLEQLDNTLNLNTFMKEELLRLQDDKRKLHNKVQELKGNIRVYCRIRPPLSNEQDKLLYSVNYLDENSIEMYRTKDKKSEYSFDKVFGPTSTQEDIFEELSQLVQSALDGYNVCVFAYGQTGSGKTYTMEGEDDFNGRGMIPRSIDTIFITLESMKRLGWVYTVKASFLEIYNENIVDLLDPKKTNLDIRMCDAKGSDVYVPNLTIEAISSADKLKSLMKVAQRNRAVAATENNERSSRSHSVTKISLEGILEERGLKCIGNLNLIDLAGSEKFHTNETTRLRETTNINKSLSSLSNVILSLVQKNGHIPYRNSKLTHLLMPALGGNSKTLMLVNISPVDDCYNESVNSLRFASTVNRCKTGTIKKQKLQT